MSGHIGDHEFAALVRQMLDVSDNIAAVAALAALLKKQK